MARPFASHACLRPLQHGAREVDAGDAGRAVHHRQFEAGADPDIQNMAAGTTGRGGGSLPAGAHDEREGQVVNRCPTGVGCFDVLVVELVCAKLDLIEGRARHTPTMVGRADLADVPEARFVTVPPPSTRAPSASDA